MDLVERHGIAVEYCLHEIADLELSVLTQDKVVMIGHQAIRDHSHGKFFYMLFDLLQEEPVILIVAEDICLMRTAIVDVIIVVGKKWNVSASHLSPPARCASHLSK